MKKLLIIGAILISLFCMSSCGSDSFSKFYGDPVTSGDYIYRFYGNNPNYLDLFGFSPQGREKETIIIPTYIDGMKIKQIGCDSIKSYFGTIVTIANFKSEQIKNLYISSEHVSLKENLWDQMPNLENVYISLDSDYYSRAQIYASISKILYVSKTISNKLSNFNPDNIWSFKDMLVENENYKIANIIYDYNFEKSDSNEYFVDRVSNGYITNIPDIPYKSNRYKFVNWYKEPECINVFDFENELIPEIKQDKDGFDIIEETRIYAGWLRL